MKDLLLHCRGAVMATVTLAFVCCVAYPLLVFGVGQLAFPHQANGSLITDPNGRVRGSRLLGQSFTADRYFHPRPSAAGIGYDAANSSGSNLGPTSKKLADAIGERIAAYRQLNGLSPSDPVPADAVTASGSGLDPHITPRNAALQTRRVAQARSLAAEQIRGLIAQHTDPALWGFLGEPGVNVVTLNRALDALTGPTAPAPAPDTRRP